MMNFPQDPPLLYKAQEFAHLHGQSPNALHVVYVALFTSLYDQNLAGPTGEALLAVDSYQRYAWMALVQYELGTQQAGAGWNNDRAQRFGQYQNNWQRTAQEYGVRATNALVLWTILKDDDIQSRMMRVCGIDPGALVNALYNRLAYPDPYHGTNGFQQREYWPNFDARVLPPPPGASRPGSWQTGIHPERPTAPPAPPPQVPNIPPTPADVIQGASLSEANRIMVRVTSSEAHLYYELHADEVRRVVAKLVDAMQSHSIPVLAGPLGSPVDKIGFALSHFLAQQRFAAPQQALLGCTGIYSIFTPKLAQIEDSAESPRLTNLRTIILQRARAEGTMLLLDHLEQIRDQDISPELWYQLSDQRDVPALGVYHTLGDTAFSIETIQRIMPNATLVPIYDYTPAQTRELLQVLCSMYWPHKGFKVDVKAFERVLALRDGAWDNLYRKWLPYLAVDVADELMESIRQHGGNGGGNGGDYYIRRIAQGALGAIERLQTGVEWSAITQNEVREALTGAQDEIERLARKPALSHDRQNHVELNRALITAQFLDPSDGTEYHVPPHKPRGVQ